MRKLILRSNLSPGDIVTMTAAVRDLHAAHPGKFLTDVRTPCPALWENNPHVTPIPDGEGEEIHLHYPLIDQSNQLPFHFIHGYRMDLAKKLGVEIPAGPFKGDVHLSDEERGWMSQIEEIKGLGTRFWIVVAGGKSDFTCKVWDPERMQAVVDRMHRRGTIVVQVGESKHNHPALRNVIDLRGKTDLRELVRLVYHCDGVVCPVTSLMHLAAAVPWKHGSGLRPCVVIAGGREPAHWEEYPGHKFIHTIGALDCCSTGGCWKSRVVPLGDGEKHDQSLCARPVQSGKSVIPQCMRLITVADVINAVESYQPRLSAIVSVAIPQSPQNSCGTCKSDSSDDPKVWGPRRWQHLHAVALTSDPANVGPWLKQFVARIPCEECREHFKAHIEANPPVFESRDSLFAWTVEAHNAVNRRLGKPELGVEEARQKTQERARATVRTVTGKDVRKAREAACLQCGEYDKRSAFCGLIGRKVAPEIRSVNGRCPADKWPASQSPIIEAPTVLAEAGPTIASQKVAVCISIHGGHRKSNGITLRADDHLMMLEDVVAQLTREESFPVVVNVVGAWKWNVSGADLNTRLSNLKEHVRWIEYPDAGHQLGAMSAVYGALREAAGMKAEWMFFAAEDTFFSTPNPVRDALARAESASVDYIGDVFLDEIGIQAVSTQVFLVRTSRLHDPERGHFPFTPELFTAVYNGLEHYMVQTLINHQVPYLREMPALYASTHDPAVWKQWRENGVHYKDDVLLRFSHGLGDAVQFTCVLKHLSKYRPNWSVTVESGIGKHSLFHGLCAASVTTATGRFKKTFDVEWSENDTPDPSKGAPCTKVVKCLRDVFDIEPDPVLMSYTVNVSSERREAAACYLSSVGARKREDGRFSAVAIHYEGNTSKDRKDLHSITIEAVCEALIEGGITPIILDWDNRSHLPDGLRIFCPKADSALWGNIGTGDGETLAALISQCAAFVGIDSGPLHVAGATGTPSLGVWTGHSPIKYFDLSANVVHLVSERWRTVEPCNDAEIAELQAKHYRLKEYPARQVSDSIVEGLNEFGLSVPKRARGFTMRRLEQEWEIVADIYKGDSYRTNFIPPSRPDEVVIDVGANIGAFARRWHERNPQARIVCIEAAPENIPLLQANVGHFATVIHAACTYETNELVFLNACGPNGMSTGGSMLVTRQELASISDSEYFNDTRPLRRVTLEEVMQEHGFDRIDVLKLDCEGSEFSILGKGPIDRMGFIVGEYHGLERWNKLRADRFPNWEYGHMSPGEIGTFHLRPRT